MDAAVFVLTADPPVSASERDLLEQVSRLSVTTFAVLNKADHLDEPGQAEALEFTRRVLGEEGELRLASEAITVRCLQQPDGSLPESADQDDLVCIAGRAY